MDLRPVGLAAALLAPLGAAARAGMAGPQRDPAAAPWACRVGWTNVTTSDYTEGGFAHHDTYTQTGLGSGFLLEPGVVLTSRHVVPGFTPSEGMTVLCGGEERTADTWRWLDAAPEEPSVIAPEGTLTGSPNDLAVIFLQSAFDVDAAALPRLARSRVEADSLIGAGRCTAWGWAGTDALRSHPVTRLEDDHQDPELHNPVVGPPATSSGARHIGEYPNPIEHGDSGGPVVCPDPSAAPGRGRDILVALVEGESPNGRVGVYLRLDGLLDFICGQAPDYCRRNRVGPSATLTPMALDQKLKKADGVARLLAGQ